MKIQDNDIYNPCHFSFCTTEFVSKIIFENILFQSHVSKYIYPLIIGMEQHNSTTMNRIRIYNQKIVVSDILVTLAIIFL